MSSNLGVVRGEVLGRLVLKPFMEKRRGAVDKIFTLGKVIIVIVENREDVAVKVGGRIDAANV